MVHQLEAEGGHNWAQAVCSRDANAAEICVEKNWHDLEEQGHQRMRKADRQ
jgi:hypothetical protein